MRVYRHGRASVTYPVAGPGCPGVGTAYPHCTQLGATGREATKWL